ncbi:hypothetical protein R75461_07848 [Paraburkholderia nemoris]|uniref:hypothetical protein n=1 Tax=Paraburkholderia nemoris TaxID=2793076 RepID=UPI001AFDA722|nr:MULTISPECIES: hypothetical protein [Paraburkholderia]CAE6858433.1 hypothetical protein R75461_07848 [Paraburkholderia nemoris]
MLWEAADRVCGERLKALIPKLVDAMERHGHLELDPVIKAELLEVSAATIDRMLANARLQIDGQRKRRKGVGSAIRRSIPVRTFADWRDPPPGFFEIDMVEHCGGSKTDGEFVHTLTLTDIASGWTECVAKRTRNQMLVIEAFDKVAADRPFAMRGVDSDNDTAFMNQSVFDYCTVIDETKNSFTSRHDFAVVIRLPQFLLLLASLLRTLSSLSRRLVMAARPCKDTIVQSFHSQLSDTLRHRQSGQCLR